MTLVPATASDAQFTHDTTRANMEDDVRRHWGGWDEAIYWQNYARTENLSIVIDGERIGCVRLVPDGDRLVLEDVQIVPVWQNRGVGRRVLDRLAEMAAERGLVAVRLRCFHDNPAYRLYVRSGFAVVEPGDAADWLEKQT